MGRAYHPFVKSSENRLGIGKLTDVRPDCARVEYFRSPADEGPISVTLSPRSLKEVILPQETRVYHRASNSFTTDVGRVLAYHEDNQSYFVRFPNDQSRMIPCDELQVRCRLPIDEPTDHLACQLNDTAFWYSARSEFVRHLLEQHRVSRGLPALLSSSIEIVAHQASVIQRVVLDPFQRYLLADEVGLGKTIEAGVLIKQFTLDQPDAHDIVIIVPDSLRVQWQQELTHRFHLGALLDTTIHVVGNRDAARITSCVETATMVVIDEAHHLCSWAWSLDPTEQKIFDTVKRSAENLDRRVLLLSATPVLHNEQSFLAMLHVLDPQIYPLDGLELFKQRVHMRQEIAECMLSLSESESNFFLSAALEELGGLLANDAEFQVLRGRLATLIDNDVNEDDRERNSLVRLIRTHVSDIWRLHRRILRNRRTDKTAVYMPGRAGLKRVIYRCEHEKQLAESVESWRVSLSVACFSAGESEKESANRLARTMEEFATCEPEKLIEFALQRLNTPLNASDSNDSKSHLPIMPGEASLLHQIVRAARNCNQEAKLQSLLQLVGSGDSANSFVIFATYPQTADRIYKFLESHSPPGRTLRHNANSFSWTQFKSKHRGYTLVCDRSAEEGLNLQKRGACAIHYDLPFSPNRLEQRMGRLDRFGAGRPVGCAALICQGSNVLSKWCDLLDNSLGVFSRSIASLQYVIEESLQQLWQEFLDTGADSFVDASSRLGGVDGLVARELKRIRAQDEIDSFDVEHLSQQAVDILEQEDRELAVVSRRVFTNWAVQSLHFRQRGEDNRNDAVFTYEFTRRIDRGRHPRGQDTLMPEDEFIARFSDSIDTLPVELPTRYTTVPMTFDRGVAQGRATRLLRVGDPFVDAFEDFTRWDDRGMCYAFWRHVPQYVPVDDPDVFFKFDYVVSPNPEPLLALCRRFGAANSAALLRRTRAIMVPRFATIVLDSNLERVHADDALVALLAPPFSKRPHAQGRDFNLNRDRWSEVATVYDLSLWRDRCAAARRQSECILRQHSKLPAWSEECIAQAQSYANQVTQQYRSRLAMATGAVSTSLKDDLDFEMAFLDAQIQSFTNPELRVDSVGAIFLSPIAPFTERPTDAEDEL